MLNSSGIKNLLIYGTGGYIESIVLPRIRAKVPDLRIAVMSNRPAHSANFAAKQGVECLQSLADIPSFDAFFLASSPLDYPDFMRALPDTARVWVEKPLCELAEDELRAIVQAGERFAVPPNTGMNKRHLPELVELAGISEISGTIDMRLDYAPAMEHGAWRQYLLRGGVYWADGVHAFDLGLFLLGDGAGISFTRMDAGMWEAEVASPKGRIRVRVGREVEERTELNGTRWPELWSPDAGHRSFDANLAGFLEGNSNWQAVVACHEKMLKACLARIAANGPAGGYAEPGNW